MQLSKYISELLYRYECVMVPNFGGFVTNQVSSQRNSVNHQFTPPTKTISFNVNLQQNDGLLVNHIAKALNLGYDDANKLVNTTVDQWMQGLQKAPLLLEGIGEFVLADNQITFAPIEKINYLTASFGLSTVDANYILRPTSVEQPVAKRKSYKKHLAVASVVAGLFFVSNIYVNQQVAKEEHLAQQKLETKIQQASFNILNPLPSVTLTVEKDYNEKVFYKYHVIAGAFKEEANAKRKVELLNKKGFSASIVGVNKWGLTQVSYGGFNDKRTAINTLNSIRKKDNKYAWLFLNE